MDKVFIEDCQHMTTLSEIVTWMKLTHLLLGFSLKLRAPLYTSTFTSIFLKTFFHMYTLEKYNTIGSQ